jgi:hypothetical protein
MARYLMRSRHDTPVVAADCKAAATARGSASGAPASALFGARFVDVFLQAHSAHTTWD